ncbi:unnamed protein product [Phytophthora lilii]|uniref:Unnamed protein product n=1 Tax=Phytophthora lilii TaxID=2077276 RepID=A0A9W6YIU6_9STRA|nr:unnamed protein product [Phytophthora lilii]
MRIGFAALATVALLIAGSSAATDSTGIANNSGQGAKHDKDDYTHEDDNTPVPKKSNDQEERANVNAEAIVKLTRSESQKSNSLWNNVLAKFVKLLGVKVPAAHTTNPGRFHTLKGHLRNPSE